MRSRFDAEVTALTGALALALSGIVGGCSKTGHPLPASVTPADDTGNVTDDSSLPTGDTDVVGDGASDASGQNDSTATDAPTQPDFGPVPDIAIVDGPVGPKGPNVSPLTFCSTDTHTLSLAGVTPSPSLPQAFKDAWNAEASRVSGGWLVLKLSGLTSTPQSVNATIGNSDGKSPPGTQGPASTFPVSVDATTRALGGSTQTGFAIVYGSTTSPSTLAIAQIGLAGTLSADCKDLGGVSLVVKIPVSEANKQLNGQTIQQLLGAPTDAVGTQDAWRVEFDGTAAYLGG